MENEALSPRPATINERDFAPAARPCKSLTACEEPPDPMQRTNRASGQAPSRNETGHGGPESGVSTVVEEIREEWQSRRADGRICAPYAPKFANPTRPAYVQRLRTSWRCQPSSVSGRTKNDCRLILLSSRPAAARNTQSGSSSRGRATCRRRAASSCRSTTISRSLNSRERSRSPPPQANAETADTPARSTGGALHQIANERRDSTARCHRRSIPDDPGRVYVPDTVRRRPAVV